MLHLSVYVYCFISQWCNIIKASHAESLGVCEELPITSWGGSRALPLFVLCCCVFVFQTKCVNECGQQLAACPPLITPELAMCSFLGCVPPSDFSGDKWMSGGWGCVWGRWDWKWWKGVCRLRMRLRLFVHLDCGFLYCSSSLSVLLGWFWCLPALSVLISSLAS